MTNDKKAEVLELVSRLFAAGVQFKVIHDGREYGNTAFRDLTTGTEVRVSPTARKPGPYYGAVKALKDKAPPRPAPVAEAPVSFREYVANYLKDMKPEDEVVIPYNGKRVDSVRGAIYHWTAKQWGVGSVVIGTAVRRKSCRVLRVS